MTLASLLSHAPAPSNRSQRPLPDSGRRWGHGDHLRNLLAALSAIDRRNIYYVFTNRETGDDLSPPAENFHTVRSVVPARVRPLRLLWEQAVFPWHELRRRLDVVFSPGFTAPLATMARKVTVIHDLQHKRLPRNFGPVERQAWNFAVWSAVRASDRLVTPSEHVKADLAHVYRVPEDRVSVIQHGVEESFYGLKENAAYGEDLLAAAKIPDRRYLLAMSTLHPHKNWERLLEAYAKLAGQGIEEHLVIAGLPGKSWDRIVDRIQTGGLRDRVHLVGWTPRPVLSALFKYAEALVFPSMFEGFGIPVIEAMAAGLPVACSDIPVLREVAGDGAIFFDPLSVDRIAEAVARVLSDAALRNQLVERGRIRAEGLTWRAAAERTLAALLEVGRG